MNIDLVRRGFQVHKILFSITSFLVFYVVLLAGSRASAAVSCPPGPIDPSVTVCLPVENGIVPSPAHVVASTTDSNPVTTLQIYVDNVLVYQVNAATLNTYVALTLGNHLVTVQGWDSTGATFKTNVNVAMTPPCVLNTKNQTITVCTPGKAEVVSSPVHLTAGFTDNKAIQSIQVKEKGAVLYSATSAPLDVYLESLAAGAHTLTITAKDQGGTSFSQNASFTVTANAGMNNLRHIIFFVQENRSFDNYFGMLGQYRVSKGFANNVDGIPLNVTLYDSQGNPVHPYHFQTVCTENLTPFWNESHADVDGGKMDGFLQQANSIPSTIDPTGTRAAGYYDQTDLPYYYELATQFGTSDRFYSSLLSNTNTNRMYLFSATSFGHIRPDSPPQGGWTQPTIFDNMDAAGVSWRYYYQDNSVYLSQWSTWQRDSGKVFPISSYYTDIQNEASLPSVIFIERAGVTGLDEHPGNNIQRGANDVAGILNALLASPSWASSAFILTYDEGGGQYDHVTPALQVPPDTIPPMLQAGDQPGDFAHSGFRLPVTVVSPYSRPHLVSHTWRDLTSILRFIEVRFNVAPLTARDAAADDMMEFFDFSNPYWLVPPPLPLQPTNGTCDYTKEKAPGF